MENCERRSPVVLEISFICYAIKKGGKKEKKRKGNEKKKENKLSSSTISLRNSFLLVAVSGEFFRIPYLFYNLFLRTY